LSDLVCSKIFNDTKRREVSLRQLSFDHTIKVDKTVC